MEQEVKPSRPFAYSGRIRLTDPERIRDMLIGCEYYMNILNEIFVGYAMDIELEVKNSPLYKQKTKNLLNSYFKKVRTYDKNIMCEVIGEYSDMMAEIHDRIDDYIGEDIRKFQNSVYMAITRHFNDNAYICSKLYTAMTLTYYCKVIFERYIKDFNSIHHALKRYYRMFDPTNMYGFIHGGLKEFCKGLEEDPCKWITEDESVRIGFKVFDLKLADMEKIIKIIIDSKNYVQGKDTQNTAGTGKKDCQD